MILAIKTVFQISKLIVAPDMKSSFISINTVDRCVSGGRRAHPDPFRDPEQDLRLVDLEIELEMILMLLK